MLKAASAVALVVASFSVADANPHKKVTAGVGNCIFSSAELPKGKFAQWKPATSFKAGDAVYARCFLAKSLSDFAKDGKMKNSMRGPIEATIAAQGSEKAGYWATITWTDDKSKWWHKNKDLYFESETGAWTEVRYDLPPGPNAAGDSCSFKLAKFNKPDDCVDLAEETKNLAAAIDKKGKYETEICLDLYFHKVDRTKTVNLKTVDDVVAVPMARGCFKYTVN